jgi:hypothetical protein
MSIGAIQRDLNNVYNFAGLKSFLQKHDKNDDGVLSPHEVSPLETRGIDLDQNKAVTIPEIMAARSKIFTPQNVQALKQLLDDPQVDYLLKKHSASTILDIIEVLSKRGEINLASTSQGQYQKNKLEFLEVVKTIKASLGKTKAMPDTLFKLLAKLILPIILLKGNNMSDIRELIASPINRYAEQDLVNSWPIAGLLSIIHSLDSGWAEKIIDKLSGKTLYYVSFMALLRKEVFLLIYKKLSNKPKLWPDKILKIDSRKIFVRLFLKTINKHGKLEDFAKTQGVSLAGLKELSKEKTEETAHKIRFWKDTEGEIRDKISYYLREGLFYYNAQFNPQKAWKYFKEVVTHKYHFISDLRGSAVKGDKSIAYYNLGLLYLYATNNINYVAKLFKASVKLDYKREIYQKHPSIYYLAHLKNAKYLGEEVLFYSRARKGMDWWVGSPKRKMYRVRRYRVMDGQTLSLVFDKKGRFVTLIPGEISMLGGGKIHAFYTVRSGKKPINFSVSYASFEYLDYNSQILKAVIELPTYFFKGLKRVVLNGGEWPVTGIYDPYKSKLEIAATEKIETFSHELLHHFDFGHLSPKERELYRKISWHKGRHFAKSRDQDHRDFTRLDSCSKPGLGYRILTTWEGKVIKRKDCNKGSKPYGLHHPYEDFATFGEDYYNRGIRLRKYVIEQISQGNFEPAVKYMFFKYIVFKGEGMRSPKGEIRAAS